MLKRVLIIDDDDQLNRINEKILSTSGLVSEVHVCRNGKEALEYLRVRVEKKYALPHVIITDLDMPVFNGFEFIAALQQWDFPGKTSIEIVVFTGSSNPKDKQKAHAMGIQHYIPKPYLLRPLREVLTCMGDVTRHRTFGLERTTS